MHPRVVWTTVHRVYVILSAAKNLAWDRQPLEILHYTQNDGLFQPANAYRLGITYMPRKQLLTSAQSHLAVGDFNSDAAGKDPLQCRRV
jgi:hypothetical protein